MRPPEERDVIDLLRELGFRIDDDTLRALLADLTKKRGSPLVTAGTENQPDSEADQEDGQEGHEANHQRREAHETDQEDQGQLGEQPDHPGSERHRPSQQAERQDQAKCKDRRTVVRAARRAV